MNWIGSYCIGCRTKLKYKSAGYCCQNKICGRYGLITIFVLDRYGVIKEL